MGDNQNISQYFANAGTLSVFDNMLGPANPQESNNPGPGEENTNNLPEDAVRDLWLRPSDKNAVVAMLTSPGILSNNDLVGIDKETRRK